MAELFSGKLSILRDQKLVESTPSRLLFFTRCIVRSIIMKSVDYLSLVRIAFPF